MQAFCDIRDMKTTQQKIKGFYKEVLEAENLPNIPLVFCPVAFGGACVEYNSNMYPVATQIDLNRCKDFEFAILHEVAHLKLLISKKDVAQRHNKAFRKIENEMIDKYTYSSISLKHFAS